MKVASYKNKRKATFRIDNKLWLVKTIRIYLLTVTLVIVMVLYSTKLQLLGELVGISIIHKINTHKKKIPWSDEFNKRSLVSDLQKKIVS